MYKLRNKIVFNINNNMFCVLGIYGSNYSELLLDIDMKLALKVILRRLITP